MAESLELTSVVESIGNILRTKGWSLASAESCTGGRVASLFTIVPGASAYFRGGVIAYTRQVKEGLLGVLSESIDTYGIVSAQVAKELAEGVCYRMGADIGIATTGWASEVDSSTPVGEVWLGVSISERVSGERITSLTRELHLQGNRQDIINQASVDLIYLLYEVLLAEDKVQHK